MERTLLTSALALLATAALPASAHAERRRGSRARPAAAVSRATIASEATPSHADDDRSARTAPSRAASGDDRAGENAGSGAGDGGASAVRPGTRAGFVQGGLGFSVGGGAAFRLQQNVGVHFSGNSSGPWIAGELNETISGAFGMTFGARFGWDIQIANFGMYVTPSIGAGAGFFAGGQDPLGVIDFNVGADFRVVLFDRVALFARPVSVGVAILPALPQGTVAARYEFLLGAGATF